MNIENEANRHSHKADAERRGEKKRSYLSKVAHISAALTAMLAAELGVVEVNSQSQTDLLNTKGDFESTTCPLTSPPNWNQIINDPSFPPIYHCAGNPPPLVNFTGNSAVEVDYYGNGSICNTNGFSYNSTFAASPADTITDQFAAAYEIHDAGATVKPQTKITWKDSSGNVTGTDVFSPTHTKGQDTWEQFSKTYGPNGVAIPAKTVSGTIEVGIQGSGSLTCTTNGIKSLEYIDAVQVLGPTTPSPTPPPISVGGIAEQPDLSQLQPAASVSHSSRDTIFTGIEIAVGSATALAGTIVVAEALKRRNRQ